MNSFYYKFIGVGLCLSLYSCSNRPKEKYVNQVNFNDSIIKPVFNTPKNYLFYIPESRQILDSTLFKNSSFSQFKESLEGLEDLNLLGIDDYLNSAILANNKVIFTKLPEPFEVPAVKSRLRVVKTHLLRSGFYSQEEDMEALSLALKDVFVAYDALIKRIDDIAIGEETFIENKFEVKQKKEK
tara:strand:+ start:249 stop:800 length:552 start_codon:yes stop_codon:yes gene_type:complete